jgi:2-dehydropantoate 2-reductase
MEETRMKIMIMGSGGVGAYYGGLLAKHGNDVTFIARGAHLEALRKNGLQVKSVHGDFSIVPAQATDNPAEVGHVDLILFCVKTYSTDEAAQAIQPAVGPQTAVISLQNGVDAAERIGGVVGAEHVLGGVAQLSSAIEAPGVVKQVSQFRRIIFGEFDGNVSERARAIESVLKEAEIATEISKDIQKELWTKLVFICAAASLGSLTRLPMGDWRAVPETRDLAVRLMKEVEAVGRAHGVNLDADVVEKSLAFIDAAAPRIKPSMQVDVEAGRQTELEALIGVVGRKGSEKGVPTPTADAVYAALLPVNLKALRGG